MIFDNLLIYGFSFALGAAGALAVARFGRHWSLLDRPNERSSHAHATPRGGGVGIVAAFVVCSLFCAVPAGFWVPAALLALVSFLEDRFDVSVSARLLAQFSLALCFLLFWWAGGHVHDSGLFRGLSLSLLYLVFLVGTANFYNFMDGINGIAGITGIIAFGLLGCYGLAAGKDPALATLSLAVAAACAGFLPFNAPRAWVFMGDVGSILLGFTFSGLVVMMAASAVEFILMAGFLFPFYADELVTLVERVRDGQNPARAHRRHLYQVLANEAGYAHWRVSAGYGLAQLLTGLIVWKIGVKGLWPLLGIMTLFVLVFIGINNRIKKRYQLGGL